MALKRLPAPTRIKLPPVKLWLDDLEELYEILRGGDAVEVTIEADGRSTEVIDDLTELPNAQAKSVTLSRIGNYGIPELVIEVATLNRTVWATSGSDAMRGLAYTAAGVLQRRQRLMIGRIPVMVAVIITFTGAAAGVVSLVLSFSDGPPLATWLTLGPAVVLIWAGNLCLQFSRSIIITRRKADSPGFFRRNRDRLLADGLLTLFAGAVGFLLGRLQ